MKRNLLTISAVVFMAVQPMSAGAATVPGSELGATGAGKVITPATARGNSILLLAQNQNQNQGENQNSNANQNENQNQNTNQNQNEPQNRNDDTPAALAAATTEAVTKPNHVCFHDSPSYKGEKFCVEPGNESTLVPAGWNDRISSIEIVGKVKVTVCTNAEFTGTCEIFRASVDALPKNLDDSISSWKAE